MILTNIHRRWKLFLHDQVALKHVTDKFYYFYVFNTQLVNKENTKRQLRLYISSTFIPLFTIGSITSVSSIFIFLYETDEIAEYFFLICT